MWTTSNTAYPPHEQQIRDLARAYRDLAKASADLPASVPEMERLRLTELRMEVVERILDLLRPGGDEAGEGE